MAKTRVYELAKELGVESRTLLAHLKEMGEFVRSASSTLDPSVVRRVRATATVPLRSVSEDVLLPTSNPTSTTVNRDTRPTPSEETLERSMERSVRRASGLPRAQSPSDFISGSDDRGYILHDEATLKYVRRLNREYPLSVVHRKALRLLKSDFSWAKRQSDGSWLVLINFGSPVAGVFGFTRGVIAVYSPFPDLQPRLFKALPDALRELPDGRLAEDHIFLVSTPDVTSRRKLDSWSHEVSYTAIAMPNDSDERRVSSSLFEALLGRLANRNLFDESLPVTGSDFFGRRQLLAQLVDEVRQGNVCGVFGLRKTGKTSLLKELGQRYRGSDDRQRIFMLRDLESLPGDPSAISEAFVQDLQASFLTEFRQRGIKTHLLADLPTHTTLGEFRRALEYSVKECQKQGIQIVLALDEVESLLGDANELQNGSRPIVPEILGTLRSLVQENPNFNVVLAGITSSAFERGEIYGRENPMFSWAKTFYLPPLSGQDISQLTRDIGRRMAVEWTESALIAMYAQSGGNIFLHRTLAAAIASHLPPPEMTGRLVNSLNVTDSINTWHRSVAQRLRDMLESTERHYPVECELLNSFMHDRVTFDELEASFPAEVHRLLMLGLLVEDSNQHLELGPLSSHLMATGLA